jgi:prepilin-type N-terminal cleavage/methylation domain-containing protein
MKTTASHNSTIFAPNRRRAAAFTLIEMLVVIAIIGILASMILTGLPGVAKRRDVSRLRAELKDLETAIEGYKDRYGSYPPDTGMPTTNTLFYELGGVRLEPPGALGPTYTYFSLVDDSAITAPIFTNAFKFDGVMNVSSRQAGVTAKAFREFKSSQYTRLTNGPLAFCILTTGLKGNVTNNSLTNLGRVIVPWQYVVDKAVHNPGKYDLFVTFKSGNETITIGNWKN